MPLLGATGGGSAKGFGALANLGYFIRNSLRFRGSATAYLSRTPNASSRTTWTWSGWVKRGALGISGPIFASTAVNNDTNWFAMKFTTSDTISVEVYSGNILVTTQVFRDPSAWYHITLAVDTTQATSSNRVKLYINGNQVTTFSESSYPSQNALYAINAAQSHVIGSYQPYAADNFDGYMGEINFIDGQGLTPSSFGKTDPATNQWIPKKFAGTYGTNGFYLKFADASAATAAAIGKDSSPNGNNWTPNNISVTAGGNYDAMIDSPTLSAAASNYAVWNPLDSTLASISGGTREANLTIGNGVDLVIRAVRATFQLPTTGKWYWECIWSNTTSTSYLGIVLLSVSNK